MSNSQSFFYYCDGTVGVTLLESEAAGAAGATGVTVAAEL